MTKCIRLGVTMAALLLLVSQTHAQNNEPPPPGAILDLGGTPLPSTYTAYTTPGFVATTSLTDITFAFRDDPAFISLDGVTMYDVTTSSPVTVLNGDFGLGPLGASAPTDWAYLNIYGAQAGGIVENSNPAPGFVNNYYDGAVQAYDAITQAISTTIGDTYTISFLLDENSGQSTFSDVSTNGQPGTGGNGIDLLVYEGATIPPTPEPASVVLLGTGFAFAGVMFLRRKSA